MVSILETAMDKKSFIDSCEMNQYFHAGFFAGKGIFNFVFGIKDLVETILIMKSDSEKKLETLDQ